MRELRSCDFCGGDAAGTFEIVPSELDPSEAEQRRVVLCPDCRDRLEALLEPLLARAGADESAGSERDGTTAASTGADSRTDGAGAADSRAVSVASGADADADANQGRNRGRNSETTAAGGADSASGITIDDDADEGDEESGSERAGSTARGTAAADSSGRDAGSSGTASPSSVPGAPNGQSAPPAYGKAMRLLSNRQFPMERDEVEGLLAGAYDLEAPEVQTIVDHAIEQGRLSQDGDQLRRT